MSDVALPEATANFVALAGVVFCQVQHFIHNWQTNKRKIRAYETYLVCVASFLSVLKVCCSLAFFFVYAKYCLVDDSSDCHCVGAERDDVLEPG